MERTRSYVTGMLLSFISWEAWQSIFLSIIVALIGGFAAAVGRQLHQILYERKVSKRKIKENEQKDSTNNKPVA